MPKMKGWTREEEQEGMIDPKGGEIVDQWSNDNRFAQVVVTKRKDGRWNRIIRDSRLNGNRVKAFDKRSDAMSSAKNYIDQYP